MAQVTYEPCFRHELHSFFVFFDHYLKGRGAAARVLLYGTPHAQPQSDIDADRAIMANMHLALCKHGGGITHAILGICFSGNCNYCSDFRIWRNCRRRRKYSENIVRPICDYLYRTAYRRTCGWQGDNALNSGPLLHFRPASRLDALFFVNKTLRAV
jgi:hypothetical protein